MVEVAAWGELHDKVDLCFCGEDFEEFRNVRVAQSAHDRDLAFYLRRVTVFKNFFLAHGLNCHALSGYHVPRVQNDAGWYLVFSFGRFIYAWD
ncbi:hypothetical protein Lal_00021130 [Lupinus albus]|nr:hypothetical protein Lal_00021130 [Lupinus albus]